MRVSNLLDLEINMMVIVTSEIELPPTTRAAIFALQILMDRQFFATDATKYGW
jgi:hypothetical protein